MWRSPKQQKKAAKQAATSPHSQMVKRQILIGVVLCIVIGTILSAVWYVAHVDRFQIKAVEVTGGFTIPQQIIKDIAESELEGEYLRLIPRRFGFMYPHDAIVARIKEVDRVKSVSIERNDNNNLEITFEEHRPFALWCGVGDSARCVFIDATGLAFAPAPELVGGAFVRYVTGDEPEVDTYVTGREFLDDTAAFIEKVKTELSLYVTQVERVGDYDIEYQIARGGHLKVSQTMSAEDSFNNLKTILGSDEFAHLEHDNFNYIDLRFGDKVFVNEVTEEVIATSTEMTAQVQTLETE